MFNSEFPGCCGIMVIQGLSEEDDDIRNRYLPVEDFDDVVECESEALRMGYTLSMVASVPEQKIWRKLAASGYTPLFKFESARTHNTVTVWVKQLRDENPITFLKAVKQGEVMEDDE